MALPIDPDHIAERDLQSLVENGVAEGILFDYKGELYVASDSEKREFLKDVSSFANTAGGHIIIGMTEDGGVPTGVIGVQGDLDQEKQRLENLLRDRMEPRIVGVRMRAVALDNGRYALVIRVPKSWNPPHAVLHNQSRLIFARNSAGAHMASVDEMRSMFLAGATLLDRAREFHRERMQEVHSADGPGPHPFGGEGGRILLHVIPFSAFSSEGVLDLGLLEREYLPPIWCSGYNIGYNADGFYTTSGASTNGLSGYVQVFRSGGVIESAAGDVRARADQGFSLYADNFENEISQRIENYMTVLSHAGVAPPMLIMLSGIRMHGTTVIGESLHSAQLPLRKSDLLFPAVSIEAYGMKKDYCRALKPIFDTIWNAAGCPNSPSNGPGGKWA
jgi:hypothetical protein